MKAGREEMGSMMSDSASEATQGVPSDFRMLMRAEVLQSMDKPTLQLNNEDIPEDD